MGWAVTWGYKEVKLDLRLLNEGNWNFEKPVRCAAPPGHFSQVLRIQLVPNYCLTIYD